MTLSLQDLYDGPKLPAKEVYIDALEDTIIIKPVPMERYREYGDAAQAGDAGAQQTIIKMVMAESLKHETGLTIVEADEVIENVSSKMHNLAFNQIGEAVLATMFGETASKDAGNG
jgi:hypothetical protein